MASLQALLLCDFAQVRGGLLFVSSGGLNIYRLEKVPGPLNTFVAGTLLLEPDEAEQVHELRFKVTGDGNTYANKPIGVQFTPGPSYPPGDCPLLPFSFHMSIQLDHHGVYDLVVYVDDVEDKRLSFRAVENLPR